MKHNYMTTRVDLGGGYLMTEDEREDWDSKWREKAEASMPTMLEAAAEYPEIVETIELLEEFRDECCMHDVGLDEFRAIREFLRDRDTQRADRPEAVCLIANGALELLKRGHRAEVVGRLFERAYSGVLP